MEQDDREIQKPCTNIENPIGAYQQIRENSEGETLETIDTEKLLRRCNGVPHHHRPTTQKVFQNACKKGETNTTEKNKTVGSQTHQTVAATIGTIRPDEQTSRNNRLRNNCCDPSRMVPRTEAIGHCTAGETRRVNSNVATQAVCSPYVSSGEDHQHNGTFHCAFTEGEHSHQSIHAHCAQLEQVPFLEVQQQTRAKAPYKPCRENREDNTPQIGGEIGEKRRPPRHGEQRLDTERPEGVPQQTHHDSTTQAVPRSRGVRHAPSTNTRTSPETDDFFNIDQGIGHDQKCLEIKHISSLWPLAKTPHASPEEVARFHAHTKHVKAVDLTERQHILARIDAECKTNFAEKWSNVLSLLETYRDNDRTSTSKGHEISAEDVKTLLADGIIQHTTDKQLKRFNNVRMFSVVENKPHKGESKRRRIIQHTPQVNVDLLDHEALDFSLPPQKKLMQAAKFAWGAQVDFKAYFHQFKLTSKLKKWGFEFEGQWYSLQTIPTGAVFSPFLANLYSEAIAALLRQRLPKGIDIQIDVYIDNLRIAVNDESLLLEAIQRLFDILLETRVEPNESKEEVIAQDHKDYTFIGIRFNHEKHTTEISEKTRNKLSLIDNIQRTDWLEASLRQLLQVYGVLLYASNCAAIPKGVAYHFTKFMRRRAGQSLDEPGLLWPSLIHVIRQWIKTVLEQPPFQWQTTETPRYQAELFTDASDSGFGAILFTPFQQVIIAGPWTAREAREHINVKEIMAVHKAMSSIEIDNVEELDIVLRIDNTSALYSLQKGDSRSHKISAIVVAIHHSRIWKQVTRIEYVNTKKNSADILSRLRLRKTQIITSSNPFLFANVPPPTT